MNNLDKEVLAMAIRGIRSEHSIDEMQKAFRARTMDDRFAVIGKLVFAGRKTPPPHILVWTGYEHSTFSQRMLT